MLRRLLILGSVAASLLVAGCGLFKARNPEKPSGVSNCPDRTVADNLSLTIRQSYGDSTGVTCYTSILDPAFAFHPDPNDSLEDPTAYVDWNESIESRVASNLAFAALYCSTVLDSEYAPRDVSTDQKTQVRHYAYHLLFRPKASPDTTRYQGRADITFQQGGVLWTVTVWVDKRDASGYATWGQLRSLYRVGF